MIGGRDPEPERVTMTSTQSNPNRGDGAVSAASTSDIGLLNEKPLHAALKEWYAAQGDQFEVEVDGFIIDVVQGGTLIEIQTGNFSGIRQKIISLVQHYPTRLVYPIAREKWLLKLPKEEGGKIRRRKSPKRGRVEELFRELVSFPELMCRPNFSLEVLLIQEEEVRRYDGKRRWRRRGWVTEERRLIQVVERHLFAGPADVLAMIPRELPEQFTTADMAAAMDAPRWLAQKAAYCLRNMDAIVHIGKRGRSYLYTYA
ncbi:MAG TPA: hypothetical protein VK879_11160 [Candidatus Sulfomarinibacteraceae bacterium]|nr:hypothetical protein [Candidatus Sulfomarinibacteraceae bacterium]